ncbi:MAG: DUF2252 family protein [Jiangellaceae bacterium]
MRTFAKQTNLQVWYAQLDVEPMLDRLRSTLTPEQMKNTRMMLDKARTRDSMQALAKLSAVVDGERRFVATPPIVVPVEDLLPSASADQLFDAMQELLEGYSQSLSPERRHLLRQYRRGYLPRHSPDPGH